MTQINIISIDWQEGIEQISSLELEEETCSLLFDIPLIVNYLKTVNKGLIFKGIKHKKDLFDLATLNKILKTNFSHRFKLIIVDYIGSNKYEHIISKIDFFEIIPANIKSKPLKYKIDLWSKALSGFQISQEVNQSIISSNLKSEKIEITLLGEVSENNDKYQRNSQGNTSLDNLRSNPLTSNFSLPSNLQFSFSQNQDLLMSLNDYNDQNIFFHLLKNFPSQKNHNNPTTNNHDESWNSLFDMIKNSEELIVKQHIDNKILLERLAINNKVILEFNDNVVIKFPIHNILEKKKFSKIIEEIELHKKRQYLFYKKVS
jgi:hypothetical protein